MHYVIEGKSPAYLLLLTTVRKASDYCADELMPADEEWAVILLAHIAPKIYNGLSESFQDVALQCSEDADHRILRGSVDMMKVGQFKKHLFDAACSLVPDVDTDFYEGETFPIHSYHGGKGEEREIQIMGFTDEEEVKKVSFEVIGDYIEERWLDECPDQFRPFIDRKKVKEELYQNSGNPDQNEDWLGEKFLYTVRKRSFWIFEA